MARRVGRTLLGRLKQTWKGFGGGWYGIGAVATYIGLGVQDIWLRLSSVSSFSDLIGAFTGLGMDLIFNAVKAGLWPLYVWQWLSQLASRLGG